MCLAFCLCFFSAFQPVWAAETGRADLPCVLAVWAAIEALCGLKPMVTANRAAAAFMQPVTIGVKAVLDVVISY